MAETDNVQLDTSVFVSQLNQVCGGQSRNNFLDVTGSNLPGATSHSGRRASNVRQHSASCDSHVSHTSSDLTSRQKGSTRSEDLLDPRSTWRSGINSRQTTFSDDFGEEDSEVRNASMESLFSSSDRDSEFGSLIPGDNAIKRGVKGQGFTSNCSPLLRRLRLKASIERQSGLGMSCSCSTGNLDLLDCYNDNQDARTSLLFSQRRSVSLLNLCPRDVISPAPAIPKVVLTSEDDDQWGEAAVSNDAKSQSLIPSKPSPNIRRKQAKIERMYSLHSEPSTSGPRTPALSNLPPIFSLTTPESTSIPPINGGTPPFLNDALLDGNIADILFSVEALWPNK